MTTNAAVIKAASKTPVTTPRVEKVASTEASAAANIAAAMKKRIVVIGVDDTPALEGADEHQLNAVCAAVNSSDGLVKAKPVAPLKNKNSSKIG